MAGFGDAVVVVPVGTTRPAPVLVAVLGIGDSAESQCATWKEIVGTRAFVVCPRGAKHMVLDEVDAGEGSSDSPEEENETARPDAGQLRQAGWYPVDVATLDREVTAAIQALKKKYGAHVSDRELVYAGFSRGAFLGASLAARHPERFTRLVLIEGGQSPWQPDAVASFGKAGKRVLFVCGQPSCLADAETAAEKLRIRNIETRVVHGVGEGHGYRKQVKEELRRSFAWAVEGDENWRDVLGR